MIGRCCRRPKGRRRGLVFAPLQAGAHSASSAHPPEASPDANVQAECMIMMNRALLQPLLLLLLGAALRGALAQVTVNDGKTPGTYDPCLQPPTGVSRVRGSEGPL